MAREVFLEKPIAKDWGAGIVGAALIHGLIFFGGGISFIQSPQYGIQAATGGIEVNLVAALPPQSRQKLEIPREKINPDSPIIKPVEKKVLKEKPTAKQADKAEDKKNVVNNTPNKGDGSARNPGKNQTTLFSAGGGTTNEKKGYLKNPPPPYPQEAIDLGQEGLVVLIASVDKTGHVQKLDVKTSSGYRLLDESALKTVRRWKFDPAHMGNLPVNAVIEIPIRFVLKDVLDAYKRQDREVG